MKVFATDTVEISGMPWLQKGEKRIIPFSGMVTNCLCDAHNSLLSSMDAVGGQFFEALQHCGANDQGPSRQFLFSGHDVERWLLKALLGLAAAKGLAQERERLVDKLHPLINATERLQDAVWKPPSGLYFTHRLNSKFTRTDAFSLAPILVRSTQEIAGLTGNIQGLNLALLAVQHPIDGTGLDQSHYRPGKFIFQLRRVTHTIQLSWEDALRHTEFTLRLEDH